MDLIIRNAKLRHREELVDIGILNGSFEKIEKDLKLSGKLEIDANGNLASPPFIESHVHLDSALSAGNPRHNLSGTLLEAIEIWGERKSTLTKKDIKNSALTTIKWLIANGVLKIRTHTDSTERNLLTLEALLEVKDEMKDLIDIQIVAFPQDGIFSYKGMDKLLIKSIEMGADVIGGLPQVELSNEDGIKSIEYVFNLANKYDKLIDIHSDETTDENSRFIETIVKHTIRNGMEGLVSASHCTAMHNYNNDYASKIISNISRAKLNIITNPSSNALLQNRLDGYPRSRGHTRVDELLENGVNVSMGNDNIMDPFGPLGRANMLQIANLLAHTAHLSGLNQMNQLFDMITINGARTLNYGGYELELGNQADLVILDARDEQEALRLTSECLYVIRKGNIISKTLPAYREVKLNENKYVIDFKI